MRSFDHTGRGAVFSRLGLSIPFRGRVVLIRPRWLVVVFLVAGAVGWFTFNPKDHFISTTFRNDTGSEVVLKDCSDDECHAFRHSETVNPGRSTTWKIFRIRRIERWLVRDQASGHTLGCIPVRFSDSYNYGDAVVIPLSRAVQCPGHSFKKYQRVAA